ncbi:MAG: phosphatase PAP2 family protein [Bacteroidota bacterium]
MPHESSPRTSASGLGLTLAGLVVACAIGLFVALRAAYVRAGGIAPMDRAAMDVARSVASDALTPWVILLTDSGSTVAFVILVTLVALVLLRSRRRWEAVQLIAASGLGGLVVRSLKEVFGRPRPAEMLIEAGGLSFPSGHAFAATVFYGTLLSVVWQVTGRTVWRLLAAVLCPVMFVAIGLSRVYLSVHYLTDVLAGFAAGLAWVVIVYVVVSGVEHRWDRRT